MGSGVYSIKTAECSICSKEFILTPEYMYKRRGNKKRRGLWVGYQCSYSCYRQAGGDSGTCNSSGTSK